MALLRIEVCPTAADAADLAKALKNQFPDYTVKVVAADEIQINDSLSPDTKSPLSNGSGICNLAGAGAAAVICTDAKGL